MPDRLNLRHATPQDAPALVALLHATYEATWLPQMTAAAAQAFREENRPAAYVASRGEAFLVAEVDRHVVGFVDWDGDFVNALHVLPAYARQWIGQALMTAAEFAIGQAGFPHARLETDTFNTPARAFYAARGYREADRYPDQEWNSGLITLLLVKAL